MLTIPDFKIDTTPPDLASSSTIPTYTNNPTFTLSSSKSGTVTYSDGVKGVASLDYSYDYSYFNEAAISSSQVAWNLDGITNNRIYKNDYQQLTNNEFIDKALNYMNFNTNIVAFVVVYTDNTKSVIDHIVAKGSLDGAYNKPNTTTGQTVYVLSQNVSQAQTKIGTQPISGSFIGDIGNLVGSANQDIKLVKSDGSELDQGNHTVVITVTDGAGNASSIQQVFTLDTLPPVISSANLQRKDGGNYAGLAKDGHTVVFSFSSDEEVTNASIKFLKDDGTVIQVVTGVTDVTGTSSNHSYEAEYVVDTSGAYNGPLSVEYTLTDNLGNIHSAYNILSSTVTIDNSALTSDSPSVDVLTNSPQFTVTANKTVSLEVVDASSNVIHSVTTLKSTHTIDLTSDLSDGTYSGLQVN